MTFEHSIATIYYGSELRGHNMAIISFDIDELCRCISRTRPIDEIAGTFEALGMRVERIAKRIEVDITPDRPDMFTIEGAGRAISHFLGITKPRKYTIDPAKEYCVVDTIPHRPEIAVGIARGVTLSEVSLAALIDAQERIHATFGRGRKKVAIGIHDLDAIQFPLTYRTAKFAKFVPLGETKEIDLQTILREHPKGKEFGRIYEGIFDYPIVFDAKGPISFPPIINAERTRVSESTKNLLIEVTGTNAQAVRDTLHIFLCALFDRGALLENVKLRTQRGDIDSAQFERTLRIDIAEVNRLLGTKFTREEIATLLSKMGHIREGDILRIPPYRVDIFHTVDIIEDIAVAHGYANFRPILPAMRAIGKILPSTRAERALRIRMVAMGFTEVLTFTLTNKEMLARARAVVNAAEIKNPRTVEHTVFRTALLPSLLDVLAQNKTRAFPQKIFEIGRIADEKGNCSTMLAAAISDAKIEFTHIKAVLDEINAEGKFGFEFVEGESAHCIPGRTLLALKGQEIVGWCGEILPEILESFKIENPVAALAIKLPF